MRKNLCGSRNDLMLRRARSERARRPRSTQVGDPAVASLFLRGPQGEDRGNIEKIDG